MNKGWHGGNRIKSEKATPEDQVCILCRQDDSQAHWLHYCPHPPSILLRSEALKEISNHIAASANPRYGAAFRTVLMTTTEPERIWTSNWSHPQILHFTGLLEAAQALPTTTCGLSALSSEVLHLSRILSRTALQLWIVKTTIESPILRRRRITAAEDNAQPRTPQANPTTTTTSTPTDTITTPTVETEASTPQPYVHIPDTIGGNRSKRRRTSHALAAPSPPTGVLSLPIIDSTAIAYITNNIRSHRREAVLRIPHPLGGEYILYQDDLLNLGADAYASANCLCALSELALSPDPTIRWFPPDLYRSLATDTIRRTGYFPERAQVFAPQMSSIFEQGVRLAIFYVFLASHFVTITIDHTSRQLRGYDSIHGYPGTPLDIIISDIKRFIKESTPVDQLPSDFDAWTTVTDAAQREGLPRQTADDCARYAFLIASCLASPNPIPISVLTPAVVAASRPTLMSWLYHQHVPPISSYYSPSATTDRPAPPTAPPSPPTLDPTHQHPNPRRRRRRRTEVSPDRHAPSLPPRKRPARGTYAEDSDIPDHSFCVIWMPAG